MIPAGVFLALALVVAGEAVVLWVDQLARHRRERAYWDIRAQRPELYDWAKELDL